MTIGERIYELRRQRYVSQEELADIMQVSRQSVSKWETDQSYPELDKIAKLAKYFDVSTDYLITGEERSNAEKEKSEDSDIRQTDEDQNDSTVNEKRSYFRGWHYEYKSKTTVGNLPLVHVNLGLDFPPRVARGIIAIGNVAQGVVAIGALAVGVISLGALCLGLLSIGAIAISLLASLGSLSFSLLFSAGAIGVAGYYAAGGIAIGYNAVGAIAVGKNLLGALCYYTKSLTPLYRI